MRAPRQRLEHEAGRGRLKARLARLIEYGTQGYPPEVGTGKPVWDKWIADNQGKFDAKGVLDTLLEELETAKVKLAKK